MTTRILAGGVIVLGVGVAVVFGAEAPRSGTPGKAIPVTSSRPAAPTSSVGGARGPLPDPTLLDGSKQPAEKKSEFGMIGDFELPGDENARTDKAGGASQPQQQGQGAQQGGGGGGLPSIGLPGMGGAGGESGGVPPPPRIGDGTSASPVGAGDPNAKAEGIKVAQLGGASSGDAGGAGGKPGPVAIGDSAMRIQTVGNQPGVVGQQQIANANTQVYEKQTGTGGKTPTGPGSPNRTEKGQTIPSGL